MCVINFSIQTATTDQIVEAQGQYKKVGDNSWTSFAISDYENATTPDISQRGDYVMQVRVKDSSNIWSDWSNDIAFEIDCNYKPSVNGVEFTGANGNCCNNNV